MRNWSHCFLLWWGLVLRALRPVFPSHTFITTDCIYRTYGDYYFTPWGFFLTLLGTVLAALKTIYTNLLQVPSSNLSSSDSAFRDGLKPPRTSSISRHPFPSHTKLPPLTPLQLLHLLSPLAFIQTTLLAHFSGELHRLQEYSVGFQNPLTSGFTRGQPPLNPRFSNVQLCLLMMNGMMAFGLNVVSFSANKKVGPLSMTVAGKVSSL